MQNFNIKDLIGWSQQKIERIAILGAKSIFCNIFCKKLPLIA